MAVAREVLLTSMAFEGDEPIGLRERQRRARAESILEAAFEIIVSEGYDALTMEGLAARLGISRQTLYHHFDSREDIALRAMVTWMDRGVDVIRKFDPSLTPIDRLRGVVRWLLVNRFRLTCGTVAKVRHSLMPIKAHPIYREAFERRASAIEEIVVAAQRAGQLRRDLNSRLVVQMLLGLVSDASYEGLISDGLATPEEVTESVIDLFFKGLVD